MSTAAALSTNIMERGFSERFSWPRQHEVSYQATGVTFIQDRREWILAAHKRLSQLALLQAGWDSYGAEAPTRESISNSREILHALSDADFEPTSVDPSAEGGVCLSFHRGDHYGDIECFNSGEVLAVTSTGADDTNVWEIEELGAQLCHELNKIRTFIGY